jgi:adenylate kinase
MRLETRLQAPHISSGDMLREAVSAGTPLGRKAKSYMDRGRLLPDDLMIALIAERLARSGGDGGFILDGFPRTVAQAKALHAWLAERGQRLDAVLQIDVPNEELVRRLAGRRVCESCGTMFHVTLNPPATPGRCDRCGSALVQRNDDEEQTIRQRMKVYARETAPLVEHYGKAGLLQRIDGTGTRDDVFGRVVGSGAFGEADA